MNEKIINATEDRLDLDAIRKRLENSEGPWSMSSDDVDTFAIETEYQEIGGLNHSCATFLANVHGDMTTLLAEVEHLRAIIERAQEAKEVAASHDGAYYEGMGYGLHYAMEAADPNQEFEEIE